MDKGIYQGKFYGSTTVGERGQVVIPVEARNELDINSGEKVVVFAYLDLGVLVLMKTDAMVKQLNTLISRLATVREKLEKAPNKSTKKANR